MVRSHLGPFAPSRYRCGSFRLCAGPHGLFAVSLSLRAFHPQGRKADPALHVFILRQLEIVILQ